VYDISVILGQTGRKIHLHDETTFKGHVKVHRKWISGGKAITGCGCTAIRDRRVPDKKPVTPSPNFFARGGFFFL
jgi:hypothetical protein